MSSFERHTFPILTVLECMLCLEIQKINLTASPIKGV